MAQALIGTLRGNTITLDMAGAVNIKTSKAYEQRVRVVLEPVNDTEIELSAEQQARLLRDWAEHGPQGPIDHE